MDFNIENDRYTDADVGWNVNNMAYNAGEISGPLVSKMVFAQLFSKLIIKKSLQMLRETTTTTRFISVICTVNNNK